MHTNYIKVPEQAPAQQVPGLKKKLTKHDPPSEEEMVRARWKVENAQTTAAVGQSVRVPALLQLCSERNIPTANPQRPDRPLHKAGLLDLLATWVWVVCDLMYFATDA